MIVAVAFLPYRSDCYVIHAIGGNKGKKKGIAMDEDIEKIVNELLETLGV